MPVNALLPTYPPYPFTAQHAKGDRVWSTDGQEYIDFYGGHCVCSTGHSHPKVVAAIEDQAERFLFYSAAMQFEIRDRAATKLAHFAGPDPWKIFFCNSGAEANENALKCAAILTGRSRFLSFKGGWHGRTTLALSVTDDPPIKQGLESFLAPCDFVEFGDLDALPEDLTAYAAVIFEPIQSMSGIRTAEAHYFQKLVERCRAAGTMIISDEIQTGMGRLGTGFAFQKFGYQPDFATSAKGLASGFPVGALLVNEAIAANIKPHMLGSTFGGGPVACAAILATIEVIEGEHLMLNAEKMFEQLQEAFPGRIRGHGLLVGFDAGERAAQLKQYLFDHRILVGNSKDPAILRFMPPLNLSQSAMDQLISCIREFIHQIA